MSQSGEMVNENFVFSLQKVVKETVHRAFWDLLAEELHADPPIYTRAMGLLEEVKTVRISWWSQRRVSTSLPSV